MPEICLDTGAAVLLRRLQDAGYAAYVVGGCVRDSLLGLSPHDWDLCTSALPQQVLDLFGEENCIPTGLQHGTVTVKYNGKLYETTTFRTEGAYSDGRHPDAVQFVPDVREDLARRDFTINAMAYDPEEGLVDAFGGQEDLVAGIVRAVGEPERRFEEDALRILRLYRFAARFGFAIDPKTGAAAQKLSTHLDCVSAERIEEELSRLLTAPKPGGWLEATVLDVILPELKASAEPEGFSYIRQTVDAVPSGMENLPARMTALLCCLSEKDARTALKRLKCSNALTDEVLTLLRNKEFVPESDAAKWTLQAKRLLGKLQPGTLTHLWMLCAALRPEDADTIAALQREAERLTAENACCRVNQLAVNGRDLMALGIPAGPRIRECLNALLEQVITGALPNETPTLLAFAEQFSAS